MPFALAFTAVFAALAVFQLALVFGAPLGRFAWGGQHRVLPTRLRIGSLVSIALYAAFVAVAWDRVGALALFPDGFSHVAMWVIFGYSALGIVMNAVSRSRAERFTMVPVTIILTALSFFLAMGFGELATAA